MENYSWKTGTVIYIVEFKSVDDPHRDILYPRCFTRLDEAKSYASEKFHEERPADGVYATMTWYDNIEDGVYIYGHCDHHNGVSFNEFDTVFVMEVYLSD